MNRALEQPKKLNVRKNISNWLNTTEKEIWIIIQIVINLQLRFKDAGLARIKLAWGAIWILTGFLYGTEEIAFFKEMPVTLSFLYISPYSHTLVRHLVSEKAADTACVS